MVTVILPSGEPYYVGMLYWIPFPNGWIIVVTVKYLILCKCMIMYYCNLYIYISSCICIDGFNVIMSLIGYIL